MPQRRTESVAGAKSSPATTRRPSKTRGISRCHVVARSAFGASGPSSIKSSALMPEYSHARLDFATKVNIFTFVSRGPSTEKTEQTRARILHAASQLFVEHGYDGWTMKDLAERAECAVGLLYRYFPSREALVLGLYADLARCLDASATPLAAASVGIRFVELVTRKLAELDRRPQVFRALARAALSPDEVTGVLADETAHIRALGLRAFTLAVSGASNAPANPETFGRLLYGLHLLLILLWTQRRRRGQSMAALVDSFAPLIDFAVGAASTRPLSSVIERADAFARSLLEEER